MITLDTINSIDDLKSVESHEVVKNYQEGEKEAIEYFKERYENDGIGDLGRPKWSDDNVEFYGPKKFQSYDEENNVTIHTTVYESYTDSGSTDYFYFSYKTEL